jgi:hypothetical protein
VTGLFTIHRPPGTRLDTVGKTLAAFGRLSRVRVRRVSRRPVSARVRLRVYRDDGSLYDEGSAALVDLSTSGARISHLSLALGDILPPSSTVCLSTESSPRTQALRGRVVWFKPGESRSYGIRFLTVG